MPPNTTRGHIRRAGVLFLFLNLGKTCLTLNPNHATWCELSDSGCVTMDRRQQGPSGGGTRDWSEKTSRTLCQSAHRARDKGLLRDPALDRSQQTRDIHPLLLQCWASVYDAGPTLNQQWGQCWANEFMRLSCHLVKIVLAKI